MNRFPLLDIHLTVAVAGLYAQVIPVLVLALLLEGGKLHKSELPWPIAVNAIRHMAILAGALVTLDCLYLVGVDREATPTEDAAAITALMLVGIAFMQFVFELVIRNMNKY